MNKETMSVHEALAELKVIDSRIEKAIRNTTFVTTKQHMDDKINGVPEKDFKTQMLAGYLSATDLIKRRDAIKRAVVLSNATNKVTVGDVEYTVAEAIDMKQHAMLFRNMLLDQMSDQYNKAQATAQRMNGDALEQKANAFIASQFSSADTNKMSDRSKQSYDAFKVDHTVEIVDPIGIHKRIEELDNEIQSFTVKVDSALSVSNATTQITIEY